MRFSTWVRSLAQQGISVLPPSHAVPVELHALLSDGRGLHFRCRGTTVTLRVFPAEATRVAVPIEVDAPTEFPLVPDVLFSVAEGLDHAKASGGAYRLVFPRPAEPEAIASIDGRARFAWSAHEAGLLSVGAAAALFDELAARVWPDIQSLETAA
jgi:hypothetical protein